MKRYALRLLAVCLSLTLLCATAVAQTATDVDYTVEEKLVKQLQAGSGFSGTLTAEATAAAGREGEAITTIRPFTFNFDYIYVRPDAVAQTEAESRLTLALVDGDQSLGTAALSLRAGALFLKSSLLGDGWYSLSETATGQAQDTGGETPGAVAQEVQTVLSKTAMPGLTAFALGLLAHLNSLDTTQWADVLDAYTTKIDLWIEGFRQNALLGKATDGTTTMQIDYQIPVSAMKAQLKQMVLDLLADTTLLGNLKALLSNADAERYLDPAMQSYYFYAIDTLPLTGDLTIARTVSLKGDTLALTLQLPLYDSQGKALTLSYDRHKGGGDLPDENTIELKSDRMLLKAVYQTYDTLTGTAVYQGTLLRMPLGAETFEVGADSTAQQAAQKTFSTSFTLSAQRTQGTDADGKDTLTDEWALNLTPEYTPDVTDDEFAEPTDAQKEQYVTFDPLDAKLSAAFTSGQAKNASTALALSLTLSGDNAPQTYTLTLAGKTKGKWVPEEIETQSAQPLNTMDSLTLTQLLGQAGIKSGLLLLPYISLPTAANAPTDTPTPPASPAP